MHQSCICPVRPQLAFIQVHITFLGCQQDVRQVHSKQSITKPGQGSLCASQQRTGGQGASTCITRSANSSPFRQPLTVTSTGWYEVWTYADQDFRFATCSVILFSALLHASYGQPRPWTAPLVACTIPSTSCIIPFLRNLPPGLEIKAKSAYVHVCTYAVYFACRRTDTCCGEHIKCNATDAAPGV